MSKEKNGGIVMNKKTISVLLALTLGCSMLFANGNAENGSNSSAAKMGDEPKTIIVISKSYQNQFYQAAFKGAFDAAADFGVTVTTNGPDAESNVSQQVEQVSAAINQRPTAIVLAACDPRSLEETLLKAKENGIPVIGFDSGIPGDRTGAVLATAATDNFNAGANVAKNLIASPDFQAAILKGTAEEPAIIGVLAQDATSGSIKMRVDGFINEAVSQLEKLDGLDGFVSVSGQTKWTISSKNPARVKIVVTVPPTTSQADIQLAAHTIFRSEKLVAVFAANQDAVNGVISSTNDATDLAGKYSDIFVVGFDAGSTQKNAIKNKLFFGSVSQDPYQMGYQAIKLAVEASEGKSISDVDTGSKWYDWKNIEDPEISILLYD